MLFSFGNPFSFHRPLVMLAGIANRPFFIAWSNCDTVLFYFLISAQMFEATSCNCLWPQMKGTKPIVFYWVQFIRARCSSTPLLTSLPLRRLRRLCNGWWRWSASPFRVRFWRAVVLSPLNAAAFSRSVRIALSPPAVQLESLSEQSVHGLATTLPLSWY